MPSFYEPAIGETCKKMIRCQHKWVCPKLFFCHFSVQCYFFPFVWLLPWLVWISLPLLPLLSLISEPASTYLFLSFPPRFNILEKWDPCLRLMYITSPSGNVLFVTNTYWYYSCWKEVYKVETCFMLSLSMESNGKWLFCPKSIRQTLQEEHIFPKFLMVWYRSKHVQSWLWRPCSKKAALHIIALIFINFAYYMMRWLGHTVSGLKS